MSTYITSAHVPWGLTGRAGDNEKDREQLKVHHLALHHFLSLLAVFVGASFGVGRGFSEVFFIGRSCKAP
jgi:hypothetical protein